MRAIYCTTGHNLKKSIVVVDAILCNHMIFCVRHCDDRNQCLFQSESVMIYLKSIMGANHHLMNS